VEFFLYINTFLAETLTYLRFCAFALCALFIAKLVFSVASKFQCGFREKGDRLQSHVCYFQLIAVPTVKSKSVEN
jgi:hypothetical protein